MNKKGFMFVETIIVITVLITALLIIYAGFVNVLNNEKVRLYYDDPAYLYRTIYLKSFLENNNTSVLFKSVDEDGIVRFNCNFQGLIEDYNDNTLNTNAFCESLLSSINVENLYLTNYNVGDLKNCPNFYNNGSGATSELCQRLQNLVDYKTYDYIRSLRSYGNDNKMIEGYRLITVYKNYLGTNDICTGDNCNEEDYIENYYASLKLNDVHTDKKIKNVTINVTNGTTPINNMNILAGRNLSVKITPGSQYKTDHAEINCTNNQTGLISGNNFIINNVTSDTVCTIKLPLKCSITNGTSWDYNYTGSGTEFNFACRGKYRIELWGAQGGNTGGKGAYTSGEISVDRNQKMYLFIGGTNGYNGGAAGGVYTYDGNGGGASDIRLTNDINDYNSRIMVAAGGGGAIVKGSLKANGGAGGSVNGSNGAVVFNDNGCGSSVATCLECDSSSSGDITCTTGNSCGCISRNSIGGRQNNGGTGVHYLMYKSTNTYELNQSSDGKYGQGGVPGGGGGFYGGGGGIISGNALVGASGGSSCINGTTINNMVDCSTNNYRFDNVSASANNNGGAGKAKITLVESF